VRSGKIQTIVGLKPPGKAFGVGTSLRPRAGAKLLSEKNCPGDSPPDSRSSPPTAGAA
jgi:hypothetical protein